jgi:hypothetical protein
LWAKYHVGTSELYADGKVLKFYSSIEVDYDGPEDEPVMVYNDKLDMVLTLEKIDCGNEVTHFCIYKDEFNDALFEETVSPVRMRRYIDQETNYSSLIWKEIEKF